MDALLANTKTGIAQSDWFPYWDFDTQQSDSPYPDYGPGTRYLQDAWATTDGWSSSALAVAVSNGVLSASGGGVNGYISRSLTLSIASVIMIRARCSNPAMGNLQFNAVGGSGILTSATPLSTSWQIFTLKNPLGTITFAAIDWSNYPTISGQLDIDWIYIGDGTYTYSVPILSGDRQDQQQAAVAAFTNLGSMPANPEQGVDWTGAMTGDTTFGEVDSQINTAIGNCGLNYYPKYTILNGNLKVTINKAGS